jgi:hypothetical protein
MSPAEFMGYYTDAKVAELRVAFDRVVPKDNWKKRIDRWIPIDSLAELDLIREAVIFYTVGVPQFVVTEDRMVHVTAPGYYESVGA